MGRSVAFLFMRKRKVLLEYKKESNGRFETLQIPRGPIEDRDKGKESTSMRDHAFHRHIYEQYQGTVIPLQYECVATVDDKSHGGTIEAYFVFAWDGDHPVYGFKGKEHMSRLRWFFIDDAIVAIGDGIDAAILKQAKETIRIRSVLA